MQEYLVTWMIQVEADSEEQAAMQAADMLPSAYSKSTATVFGVVDDDSVKESLLSHRVTSLDLANYFKWLRENGHVETGE